MSSHPPIISTPILPSEWDWLWEEPTIPAPGDQPPRLLVLSLPRKDEEQKVLMNMMNACQLQSGEYLILDLLAHQRIPWSYLRKNIQPKQILLLGVSAEQLGIRALFRPYEPNDFDGLQWIPAASIQDLEARPDLKKALWLKGLKPIFGA